MHIVFALGDSRLETINTLFSHVFLDMVRHMEEEWDALVHSVETGVLPEWEGTSHVRQYLEVSKAKLFTHRHTNLYFDLSAEIHGEARKSCPPSRRRKSNGATWVA